MHPLIRSLQKDQLKKVPQIRAGYTVRVSQKVKEGGKERIQHFEGLVIKVSSGEGTEKSFTVRKIVEGIGVEKVFPFHSPNITQIVVRKKAEVSRSKLYYMRQRSGKSARLSERHVTDEERALEAQEYALAEEEMVSGAEEPQAQAEMAEVPSQAMEDSQPAESSEPALAAAEPAAPAAAPAEEKAA